MPQYQGVWTLEQQAQAQSNQQWVTDPNFKNTTLLLQADGTGSGSQNQTFLDGSTNNFFITRSGTTQGSFSPFSQVDGRWGIYLDGSSNLVVSSNAVAATGVFTIEAWIYITTNTSTGSQGIYTQYTGADAGRMQFLFDDSDKKFKFAIANTTYPTTSAYSSVYNTWVHVVVSRDSSNNLTFYVNGTRDSVTAGVTGSLYTLSPTIGNRGGGGIPFYGYISNLRITNTSVYSGTSFAVPDFPLSTVTGTTLLTCQSNRFVDNNTATTAKTFTTSGTPSVQAFGPFAPALQWTPDVVGGSGYFDGSDYLAVPSSSAFSLTGDFTYEGWVYVTNTSTARYIMPSTVSMNLDVVVATGNNMKLQFFDGSTATTDAINTFPINTWAHIAVVRSGTSANNCSFYVNGVRGTQFTTNVTNSSPSIDIGRYSAGGNFYGYMGSLRIVNGQAVYSGATYTVPNAPLTTTGYGTTSQSITASNTKLLLNYTNAGIYDGKMASNLETLSNVQVATNPVKYGSGSMSFGSGTANYLAYLNNPGFVFGTGDFTVEFWMNTFDITACLIRFSTGSTGYWQMALSVSSIVWQNSQDVNNLYVASCPQAFNGQWHHIAVTRTGGINRLFFDGTLLTSAADTTNYNGSAGNMQIGWDGTNQFTGFIDDLRFTKGVARYIANFTPPQQALPRQ
jgi:hypothetical protein